jgi:hypothetical protein
VQSSFDGTTSTPNPGDPMACIRCGAVMTYDERGALRGFTDEEIDGLASDTETMAELAKLVRRQRNTPRTENLQAML